MTEKVDKKQIDRMLRQCARLIPNSEQKQDSFTITEKAPKKQSKPKRENQAKEHKLLILGQERSMQDNVLPKKLGRYRIREKLGEGAMAQVYKAYDNSLKRTVALKILPREKVLENNTIARFMREAKSIARLRHSRIVSAYDFQKINSWYIIVMEYIKGQSLENYRYNHAIPFSVACRIVLEILDGLGYAHRRDIVHRDIKPSNILIDKDNQIYITDFGLAKGLSSVSDNISCTGAILGTPTYMSPEQAVGGKVDFRTDIYSVGVILYEMLCGRPPFIGDSLFSLLYQLRHKKIAGPRIYNSKVPVALEKICLKALSKNCNGRYESAEQMAQDIRLYLRNKDKNYARKFIAGSMLLMTGTAMALAVNGGAFDSLANFATGFYAPSDSKKQSAINNDKPDSKIEAYAIEKEKEDPGSFEQTKAKSEIEEFKEKPTKEETILSIPVDEWENSEILSEEEEKYWQNFERDHEYRRFRRWRHKRHDPDRHRFRKPPRDQKRRPRWDD